MVRVNRNSYNLLRYAVWHGGKWYLRRRRPSARTSALAGVAAFSVLAATMLLARRLLN
jgi:hypothetical protein